MTPRAKKQSEIDRPAHPQAPQRGVVLEELEPRLLLSALNPVDADVAGALVPPAPDLGAIEQWVDQSAGETAASSAPATVAPTAELVFIDSRVSDADALIADLRQQAEAGRNLAVIEIGADVDGLSAISDALASRDGVGAIHVVSHANEGMLLLGAGVVDAGVLASHAEEVSGWAQALTRDADILLYGCDLAASDAGRSLVDALADLTGADVAASDDDTGAAIRGADWQLEVSTGAVEATAALSESVRASWQGGLATYVVTNTNNSGPGSLRAAIVNANASNGTDLIAFNLDTGDAGYVDPTPGAPASGDEYWRITPTSQLHAITDPVVIDATTQPGYDPGTGRPVIEIDGSSANNARPLFELNTSDSTVRGFALHSSAEGAVEISAGSHNTIQGNWIGLDGEGNVRGNAEYGVLITAGGSANRIEGNVIAGSGLSGVRIEGAGSANLVQGNWIGVLPDGTAAGNLRHGVELSTGAAGNFVGGTGTGEHNQIAHNAMDGVALGADAGAGNAILANAIYANTGLGIDLGDDGVTANDPSDLDAGANELGNHPVLTGAYLNGAQLAIHGAIQSTPLTSLRIEFFASSTADPTGFGEGERYLGSANVTTDAFGNAVIDTTLVGVTVGVGETVSATATVVLGAGSYGSTSEFAQSSTVTNPVPSVDLDADDSSGAGGGGYATTWTEGAGPVPIADIDALVSHPGNANLTSATVTLTNPLDGAAEILTADTTGTDITASYDSGTGVLTLSGTDSVAHYQQVLRTVTYDNGSEQPTAAVRAVEVRVNHGASSSAVATATVAIAPVNDPSQAVDDSAAVAEGGSTAIALAANDTDVDGALDLASIQIVTGPAHGSVAVNGDGTVTYTHDGGETTSDSFTYTIRDAAGAVSNVGAVSLSIAPVNDLPTASGGASALSEGASAAIDLAGYASDVDSAIDLTSIQIVSGPAHGLVLVNGDGTVTYTHDGGETTADTFTYVIRDIEGGVSNAAAVTLAVSAVNDAPTLLNNQLAVPAGGSTILSGADLSAADVDDAAAGLRFTVSGVSGGHFEWLSDPGTAIGSFTQAQVAAGEIRFVHDGFTAEPAYHVEVSDGRATAGPSAASVELLTPPAGPPLPPEEAPETDPAPGSDAEPEPAAGAPAAPGGLWVRPAVEPGATGDAHGPASLGWHTDPGADTTHSGATALDPGRAAGSDFTGWTPQRLHPREFARVENGALAISRILLPSIEDLREDLASHQIEASVWRRASIEAVSIAFSAGFVAAVLRSTSLWAAMLSLMPMWQRLDPLVVLALPDEERRRRQDEIRREEERRSRLDRVLAEPEPRISR